MNLLSAKNRTFKLFCYVAISIFSPYFCFSQSSGFHKDYYLENRNTDFLSVIPFDDDLVIVGESGVDTSGFNSIFAMKADTLGNVKKINFFQDPSHTDHLLLGSYVYDAIIQTSNKGFIIFGSTFYRNNLFELKVDSNLNLVRFTEYDSDFEARIVRDVVCLDSFYYVIGLVSTGDFGIDIFIQKNDFSGKKIWEKTFGHKEQNINCQSAITENGGITILGSEWFDPDHNIFNDEIIRTWFFHIDSTGEILWNWRSEENEEGGSPGALIKYNDQYYYTTKPSFQKDFVTVWFAAELVCRDKNFNLQWRRSYSDTFHLNSFIDIDFDSINSMVVTGQIYDEVTWASIYKLNPENGEVVWTARDTGIYIPGWGSRNIMQSLIILPSLSSISVGTTHDIYTGHNHGLLIKVTKDGCIDTLCTTALVDDEFIKWKKYIFLYPNPAKEEINFILEEIPVGGKFRIYSNSGSFLYEQQVHRGLNSVQFNNTLRATGVYFWHIIDQNGILFASGNYVVID